MGMKEQVMDLLSTGQEQELALLVVENRRALRTLFGRLWHDESQIRRCAARTLAMAADAQPEQGVEWIRRILWGLNDESGTHGGDSILALEEIGRRSPGMMKEFIGPLVSFAWDDSLRGAILEALVATAQSDSDLVRPWLGAAQRHVDTHSERETAALAKLEKVLGGVN